MQPRCEVADVLRHVSTDTFTIHQQKTLRAIAQCRTLALGGHVDVCDECGVVRISYNSCRNRHCPKCQGHKREEWIQKREQDLLPCTYYHVVFTLPQQLNPLAFSKTEITYKMFVYCCMAHLTTDWQPCRYRLGNDFRIAYVGAKFVFASPPALHRSRWWH